MRGAGSLARPVDQHSNALPLYYGRSLQNWRIVAFAIDSDLLERNVNTSRKFGNLVVMLVIGSNVGNW